MKNLNVKSAFKCTIWLQASNQNVCLDVWWHFREFLQQNQPTWCSIDLHDELFELNFLFTLDDVKMGFCTPFLMSLFSKNKNNSNQILKNFLSICFTWKINELSPFHWKGDNWHPMKLFSMFELLEMIVSTFDFHPRASFLTLI